MWNSVKIDQDYQVAIVGIKDRNLFLFQAEDGIRDAQESRGLGDVYKGQEEGFPRYAARAFLSGFAGGFDERVVELLHILAALQLDQDQKALDDLLPVSYTHLTLPTISSV